MVGHQANADNQKYGGGFVSIGLTRHNLCTMKLIDRLEKRFRRYAIHNLTAVLLGGQFLSIIASIANRDLYGKLVLIPQKVMEGEVWRLFTFIFAYTVSNEPFSFFFTFFYFMFFWMMGNALDYQWGSFRYNVFIFIGVTLTAGAAWVSPNSPTTCTYVYTSIFLAFAYLYPNYQILFMFLFPVKVKWLALLTWFFYLYWLIDGDTDTATRYMVAAGAANFIVFFGPEIFMRLIRGHRHRVRSTEAAIEAEQPFHVCAICGATDRTHHDREFRYMPTDQGTQCICDQCQKGAG